MRDVSGWLPRGQWEASGTLSERGERMKGVVTDKMGAESNVLLPFCFRIRRGDDTLPMGGKENRLFLAYYMNK